MIVRSMAPGHSFKWLATYLTTDPKAQTAERVAFTHTLNLAYDDVRSAVDTMLHTYRDRDLLKAEAGIRRGGSSVEKPVKHVSLAWHAADRPTQATMIEAATSYLKAMGWQDHECLIVGHTDRKHPHVHLMINAIHPQRGTRLNDSFERRRAQSWALGYEQEQGQIRCAERLKPVAEREPSPPRHVWEWLQAFDARGYEGLHDKEERTKIDYGAPPRRWRGQEWERLKDQQKQERLAFIETGKSAYRETRMQAHRTVRAAYRREWAELYALKRSGAAKPLVAEVRAAIVDRQKASLADLARDATQNLRAERDEAYRRLLDDQKAIRADLADRQEVGLASPHLLRPSVGLPGPIPKPVASAASDPAPVSPSLGLSSWAAHAGMVAQQRSANNWLGRAADRLAREPITAPIAARSPLAAAHERLRKTDEPHEKPVGAVGIEPDR